MQGIKVMSSLHKDFIASFLRSQLITLQDVLDTIESSSRLEDAYVEESLNRVQKELHQIRRLCVDN